MRYCYRPFKSDSSSDCVILDGYTEKENLEGPFRQNGLVVYFDNIVGKLLNPKTNSFIDEEKIDAHL